MRRFTISSPRPNLNQTKSNPLHPSQSHRVTFFELTKRPIEQEKYMDVNNLNNESIFHLIKDETNFIKSLIKLKENFIEKIESLQIIPKNIQSLLFENIKELYQHQKNFLQKVHSLAKDQSSTIKVCFKDFNFQIFRKYIQNFEVILYYFDDLLQKNAQFSQICKDLEKEMGEKIKLLLFSPLQEINQYYLNIHKFLSNIDPKSDIYSSYYPILQEIFKISEEPNFHPYLYLFEHQKELGNIEKQIDGLKDFELENPRRYLHRIGSFRRIMRNKNYPGKYYAFNDMMIVAKAPKSKETTKFDHLFKYQEIQLRNLVDDENIGIQNAIEIIFPETADLYICSFSTSEEKNTLWKELTIDFNVKIDETSLSAEKLQQMMQKKRILVSYPKDKDSNIDDFPIPKNTNTEKRGNIILEIIQTEEDYLSSLNIIIEYYKKPLVQKKIISSEDSTEIFKQIETIFGVNKQLLELLKKDLPKNPKEISDLKIGNIFLQVADFLKLYIDYCSSYTFSMKRLNKYTSNSKYTTFISNTRKTVPECKGLDLLDLLIKPIQRICRYPLLFQQLLKTTGQDHPDFLEIRKTYSKLNGIATQVDQRKKAAEAAKFLVDITSKIIGIKKKFPLLEPSNPRTLIKEGFMNKKSVKKIQERYFWLFNDVLIYAKAIIRNHKYSYKGRLFLAGAFVRDLSSTNHTFHMIPYGSKKSYIFYCNSEDEKLSWINEIKNQILNLESKEVLPRIK
ncbi:faciogenital dysplasia protein [Anaeramoeba ignava]|uniref:Faciogenital dysplasia protein n=1 Tax=Anaeramoeba ignava TaxID=1746090 RepID=A0A9Q0R5F3_ANAIG|nr:faciogenital dysplasia protein [Anaeramoeba ignava]